MKHILLSLLLALFFAVPLRAAETFTIAVTDPLAKELACACIDGFAQRNYKALADHIKKFDESRFGKIELVFAGSLRAAIEKSSRKRVDMIIGKDSVVRHELQQAKIDATATNRLTDKGGEVGFTGLVVVAADDPAKTVADLKKHRLILGPKESEETHAAAIALFKKHGISVPEKPEIADNNTEACFTILENDSDQPVAAVVSDYAFALIEGCDLIEKGALRVLDKTEPVPFISVFVTNPFDLKTTEQLVSALSNSKNPRLLEELESKKGFMPYTLRTKNGWEFIHATKTEAASKN